MQPAVIDEITVPEQGKYLLIKEQVLVASNYLRILGSEAFATRFLVRHFRERINLNQRELADACGMTRNHIGLIETGTEPEPNTLAKLAAVLGNEFLEAVNLAKRLRAE